MQSTLRPLYAQVVVHQRVDPEAHEPKYIDNYANPLPFAHGGFWPGGLIRTYRTRRISPRKKTLTGWQWPPSRQHLVGRHRPMRGDGIFSEK